MAKMTLCVAWLWCFIPISLIELSQKHWNCERKDSCAYRYTQWPLQWTRIADSVTLDISFYVKTGPIFSGKSAFKPITWTCQLWAIHWQHVLLLHLYVNTLDFFGFIPLCLCRRHQGDCVIPSPWRQTVQVYWPKSNKDVFSPVRVLCAFHIGGPPYISGSYGAHTGFSSP